MPINSAPAPLISSCQNYNLTFTQIQPVVETEGTGAAWYDWDISASIPANTLYVLIEANNKQAAAASVGVRTNGSALNAAYTAGDDGQISYIVAPDVNRVVEIFGNATTAAEYTLMGYWSR